MGHFAYERTEVSVGTQCRLVRRHAVVLGGLDTPCFAAAMLFQLVQVVERPFRKTEALVENRQDGVVDLNRLAHEWRNDTFHVIHHSGRVRTVSRLWEGEGVVLGDINKLYTVAGARLVSSIRPSSLVSERHSLIALLELHLFLEGEVHGLCPQLKHLCDLVICTMVLQTVANVRDVCNNECKVKDLLPESKFSGSLPESIDFGLVAVSDEIIVDDKERDSRHIVGEGRDYDRGHGVEWSAGASEGIRRLGAAGGKLQGEVDYILYCTSPEAT